LLASSGILHTGFGAAPNTVKNRYSVKLQSSCL
jgi:hypothetical protein